MKGAGWIVVLLALLGVTFLLTRDLASLTGDRGGKAVIEPLEKAKDIAGVTTKTQNDLQNKLDKIDK